MSIIPKQKILNSEKDDKWYRDNTDAIIDQASFLSDDRAMIIELYKAAMGEVDPETYKYVVNPWNSPSENERQLPARLRNYDIIIPIISLFLGEKASTPFNHTVIVSNPDVVNKQKDAMNKAFVAAMAQDFINVLNQSGTETGVDSKEVDYKKVLAEYNVDSSDQRAIFGQEALDYIKHQMSLKDKYLEAMYDWIVIGRVYTYKDVYKDDLLYEIVPPLELWHGPTRSGFIEDASWAYRRSRYSLNDIADRFHEEFENYKDIISADENGKKITDPLAFLENKYLNNEASPTSISPESALLLKSEVDTGWSSNVNFPIITNRGLIDVHHVTWKGFEKVGILTYTDQVGQVQEMEVSDDYKLDTTRGDISIKWYWMSVVHEEYRIDEDIYVYGRKVQVQRQELSNSSKCKLPYNGRTGYTERDKINSVVKQILPYQALINIYHLRTELIIAKNKEKLMLMPLGLIPDGEGWDEDKWTYFMDALGMLVFDETKPNAAQVLNALKSIDMSLGQYIGDMRNLIQWVKEEAWDAIGMNRQRYGDVNSSDGKGNNEQAIIRSSIISRELNRRFEKFEESDLQGLLDLSKVAWINGKKGSYINSYGKVAFLEVDGIKHLDADYGVFAINSQEEQDNLKMAKQYAFGIAQKAGNPYSTVLEVIDSKNMSKLKAIVNKAEQIEKQYQASIQEAQAQAAQNLERVSQEKIAQDNQAKFEIQKLKSDTDIKVALIQNSGEENNKEKEPDYSGYDSAIDQYSQADKVKQKEGAKVAQRLGDTRLKEAKLALDEKMGKEKLEIAKVNKNKYDK